MNEEFENAIHECERILSQALGMNVRVVNTIPFQITPITENLGKTGELYWRQYNEEVSFSLECKATRETSPMWSWN